MNTTEQTEPKARHEAEIAQQPCGKKHSGNWELHYAGSGWYECAGCGTMVSLKELASEAMRRSDYREVIRLTGIATEGLNDGEQLDEACRVLVMRYGQTWEVQS